MDFFDVSSDSINFVDAPSTPDFVRSISTAKLRVETVKTGTASYQAMQKIEALSNNVFSLAFTKNATSCLFYFLVAIALFKVSQV